MKDMKFEIAMKGIDAAIDTAIYCSDCTAHTALLIDELRNKADRMEECCREEFGEDWRDDFSDETIAAQIEDKYDVDVLNKKFGEFMLDFYSHRYYNEMNEDGSGDELMMKFIDMKEKEGVFSTDEFFTYALNWRNERTKLGVSIPDDDELYYWMRMEYLGNTPELNNEFEETNAYRRWVWGYVVNNIETIINCDEYKKFMSGEEVE